MTTNTLPAFNYQNLSKLVSDGQIFSVEFIKRSTGELRKMTCRMGVKKYLRGGSKPYSAKAKSLLTVYSLDSEGYRSIPVENVQRITVSGQTFTFAQ